MTASNQQQNASPTSAAVARYRLATLAAGSLITSVSTWIWLLASWQLGLLLSWHGLLACQIIALLGFAYYAFSKNFAALRFVQLSFMLVTPVVAQLSLESGGVSGIILWSFLAPVAVSMIATREERHAVLWLTGYVFAALFGYVLQPLVGYSTAAGNEAVVGSLLPINLVVFTALLALALYVALHQRRTFSEIRSHQYSTLRDQHEQLHDEVERKDWLIGSMLPQRITERLLQDENGVIADGHSDVSVMFVDIVGFTKLADSMSPKQIVRLLNQIFSGFDDIAEQYGLEKIKTIGDAFLVVGGLGESGQGDYVAAALQAAQDFRRHVLDQTQGMSYGNALDIHIGIATGPIAAGVIGKVRLSYDIWGNTVNLASRLADHAVAGQILVDQTTHKRVNKKFQFAQQPDLALKGNMHMQVYRLNNDSVPSNVVKIHA